MSGFDGGPKGIDRSWVQQGKPEGDPANNPGLPNFPEGSQIGEPDLVLSMPEPFTHIDTLDQYQVFVIPTGFTEPTEIAAVEIRPGNRAVDHHALIGYTDDRGHRRSPSQGCGRPQSGL